MFTVTFFVALSARRRDDDVSNDTDEPSEKEMSAELLPSTSASPLSAVLLQPSSTFSIFSGSPFTSASSCSSSFCGFSLLPLLYAALTCEA